MTDSDKLPPIHPGEILSEEFLIPMNIDQHEFAKSVGIDAHRIHAIVRGEESITAEIALRLSDYFGTSARFWTGLQSRYDLDVARDRLADEFKAGNGHRANAIVSDLELPHPDKCQCGCGGLPGKRAFLPGHGPKTLHTVIRKEYGSVLEFMRRHGYSTDS